MEEEISVRIILLSRKGSDFTILVEPNNTVNTRVYISEMLQEIVDYYIAQGKIPPGKYEIFAQLPEYATLSSLGESQITTLLLMPVALRGAFRPGK